MSRNDVTVTIGQGERAKDLRVLPQPIPYLEAELGPVISGLLGEGNLTQEGFLAAIYGSAYEVLGVLIPDLPKSIRKWEWDGYASEADADAGARGEDAERDYSRAASIPDIKDAFSACWEVNALGDLAEKAKGIGLDPKALGKALEVGIDRLEAETMASSTSQDLPSPNGASASKRPSGTYQTEAAPLV